VHLRLHDYKSSRCGCCRFFELALEIVDREQAGDSGIEHAFPEFQAAGSVEHRVGEHVDDRHLRINSRLRPCSLSSPPIRRLVDGGRGLRARALTVLAALLEVGRTRVPFHQTQRIAIRPATLSSASAAAATLSSHVENGADRRISRIMFRNAGRIVLANDVAAIDPDFDVQPVVDQQESRKGIAGSP